MTEHEPPKLKPVAIQTPKSQRPIMPESGGPRPRKTGHETTPDGFAEGWNDPRLTETQQRRLLARLGGKSLAEIAEAESRSKSTIAESLKAPAVHDALMILGRRMQTRDPETGKTVDLIALALEELATIALGAMKLVPVGSVAHKVPDYRTRLDAIARLLSLIEPEKPRPAPISGPTTSESEEVTRTLTATESRRRTRTPPVRN